jgi:hypothetical protein
VDREIQRDGQVGHDMTAIDLFAQARRALGAIVAYP